ncbi:MAG: TlpA family protein disulfide reductase [Acidobacteriota bacterium]|nr:TlpA family protein disulfide reductase [Acidobacteriota bacterium]
MKTAILIVIGALNLFGENEFSNRRAPGFSLADSKFQQHDPQDYRGKVMIIDFMQTTCPVCVRLTDALREVKATYGDKVAILSITTLPDTFEKADRFSVEHRISWPVLFDSGQVMMSYLNVTPAHPQVKFPHLFIVDASGTIRYDFEGAADAAEISADIDKIMK